MDRKEFLSACGLGVCGCALGLLGAPETARAGEKPKPDPQLAFVRYQVANLVTFMAADQKPEACAAIFEKNGRECAKLGQLPIKFKGDPQGYFDTAKQYWGTGFSWDKERGVITVTVPEGECGCPLVDPKRTPALFCNCSVGYQKESFETILGRPVKVALKESKLGGSTRCVFEVRLA